MTNVTVVTLKHLRIFDVAPGSEHWCFSAEFDGRREYAIFSPAKMEAGEWSNVRALLKDADGSMPSLLAWIEPGTNSWVGTWPATVGHDAVLGPMIVVFGFFFMRALSNVGHDVWWPDWLVFWMLMLSGGAKIFSAAHKSMILNKLKKES
jgi:hypothetical protein